MGGFENHEENDLMDSLTKIHIPEDEENKTFRQRQSHQQHNHYHRHRLKIHETQEDENRADADWIRMKSLPLKGRRKGEAHRIGYDHFGKEQEEKEEEGISKVEEQKGEMRGEDDQSDMIIGDSRKHHDYSGMDMLDDVEMLKKKKKNPSSSSSTFDDEDQKESIGATLSKGKKTIGATLSKGKKTKVKQGKEDEDIMSGSGQDVHQHHVHRSTKQNSTTKKSVGFAKHHNTTKSEHLSSLISSESDAVESGSGSGSGDHHGDGVEVKSLKHSNKVHELKRDKISKPEKITEDEPVKYGHKEDIFREFHKQSPKHGDPKHKVKVSSSRHSKKMEHEVEDEKQEDFMRTEEEEEEKDNYSGREEGSGTSSHKKHHKSRKGRKKKKPKNKKQVSTTTTPATTTQPTSTTTTTTTSTTTKLTTQKPTTTTTTAKTTTTTTKSPLPSIRKDTASGELKNKSHTPHSSKITSRPQNKTIPMIPSHNAKKTNSITPQISTTQTPSKTTKHSTTPTTTTTHTTTKRSTTTPKPTTRTTTTTTKRTSTRTYKVPIVPIDGIQNQIPTKGNMTTAEKKPQRLLKYNEEESLTDFSKSKKLKQIPSLNIDVGDADVESDEPQQTRKKNKNQQQQQQQQQQQPKDKQITEKLSSTKEHVDQEEMVNRAKNNTKKLHKEIASLPETKTPVPTTTTTTTKSPTTTKKPTTTTVTTFPPYDEKPPTDMRQPDNYSPQPPTPYNDYGRYTPFNNENDREYNKNNFEEDNWRYHGEQPPFPPPLYSRYHDSEGYDDPWQQSQRQQQANEAPGNNGLEIKYSDEQLQQEKLPSNLDPSFNPYNLGYDQRNEFLNKQTQHGDEKEHPMASKGRNSTELFGNSPQTKEQYDDLPFNGQKHRERNTNSTITITDTNIQKKNPQKETLQTPLKETPEHSQSKSASNQELSTRHNANGTTIKEKRKHLLLNETQHKESLHHSESPQQTVERILGQPLVVSKNSNNNKNNNNNNNNNTSSIKTFERKKNTKETLNKPIDTIHNILGDSLDNFFTESEKKYGKKDKKNTTIAHTPTQMKDNLNDFFKKAEIAPKVVEKCK